MNCVDILSAFRVPVQFLLLSEMSSILPAKISFVQINPAKHQMFVGIWNVNWSAESYIQQKSNYFRFTGAFFARRYWNNFPFRSSSQTWSLLSDESFWMYHFITRTSWYLQLNNRRKDHYLRMVWRRICKFCLPELWKFS